MRSPTVICSGCASTWPVAVDARFCGNCGGLLPPPGPDGRRRLSPSPVVSKLLGAVALLAISLIVWLPESAGPGRALEQPTAASGSTVELPLPDEASQTGSADTGGEDDQIVAISRSDRALLALDPATGAVRWKTDLPAAEEFERQARDAGIRLDPRHVQLVPAVGPGLYVAGPGWIAIFAEDGTHRWTAAVRSYPRYVQRSDDIVLLHGFLPDRSAGPPEHLAAYDAQTGAPLWDRGIWSVQAVLPDRHAVVASIAPDRLARVDTQTGEVVWEIEAVAGRWSPSSGPSVLATLPDGSRALIDPDTGEQTTSASRMFDR